MAKAKYEADDGTLHDSERKANARNALIKAGADLKDAVKRVQRHMLEGATTADGETVDLEKWNELWFIRDAFGHVPTLGRVTFYIHSLDVDLDRDQVIVREYHHDERSGGRYQSYRISELYLDKKKAQAALVKLAEERLALFAEDVEKIKKENAPHQPE